MRLYPTPAPGDKRIWGYVAAGAAKRDVTEEISNSRRIWLVLHSNFFEGAGNFYESLFRGQGNVLAEKRYKDVTIQLVVLDSKNGF